MTDDTDFWAQAHAFEEVYVPPFQPPSQELLDMLHWLNEAQSNFYECMRVEFNTQELYALGELTPRQVDTLLTRGTL